MPYINRYSDTVRGALTFTGNTIGLSKLANANQAGTIASIGAFASLNTGLQVPTFPAGTTLNISENGSQANLVIPAGSTILYAELIWGGNYFGQDGNTGITVDISSQINNQVKLTTSNGSTMITPDPATAQTQTATNNVGTPFPFIFSFYERSSNVTSLIQPLGAGTHSISVEQVPGLTDPVDNETSGTNHAGWTLAVAYQNTTMAFRNLNIWVGAQIVDRNVNPILDIPVTGFHTPATGPVTGRLLVSAQEGDATAGGDQLLFGPTTAALTAMSGPNNNVSNFFASQINNDSGNLDTTGTFGNLNQNGFTLTNISGGRQGWDITNVDASTELSAGQSAAVIRFLTSTAAGNVGESYMPNTVGLQIDSEAPSITLNKTAARTAVILGEPIQYTLTVTNNGTLATDNMLIVDAAPVGTTINVGSINVTGATGPVVNTSTAATLNIELGPVNIGQTVTITYTVNTTANTPIPVTNGADGSWTFTPLAGSPAVPDQGTSNVVTTDATSPTSTKSVSVNQAIVGDTITYTVTIDNSTGTTALTNVFVFDALQAETSYVANSTVIGANPPINSDPSIAPGINVGNVAAGATVVVKFNVKIDSLPSPATVNNTANVNYTLGGTNYSDPTNTTTVNILAPSISLNKSVDKALAAVGDHLIYTTVITNSGDTAITNIVFTDAPPANTTFDGLGMTINGNNYPALNPNNNISFIAVPVLPTPFPLQPGGTVTISYGVTIVSAPVSNQIDNTSSATADVLVGGVTKTVNGTSNIATTNLFGLTLIKGTNRTAVAPGDTITYTVTITSSNPGTYANNIVFLDTVPSGSTVVVGSVAATGATIVTNSSTATAVNLNFGPTFPNNPIVVTFDALVGNNVTGQLVNTAETTIGPVVNTSNPVTTAVINPVFTKDSSVSFTDLGATYTYIVTIDNTANNAPLTNVFVLDTLQTGTTYVLNSTVIGANPPINSDPSIAPGINVGTVAANTAVAVKFNVLVGSTIPNPNPILNTATVNYQIDSVPKTGTTNQTSVTVNHADLIGTNGQNFVKSRDLAFANVGDTITYSLTITNTGNTTANNVVITDAVPQGTSYVAGSLTGSVPVTGGMPTINVTNGVAAGQTITVSYKVKVDVIPTTNPIPNTATIAYNYTVDPANPNGATGGGPSNTVTTQVNNADLIGTNGQNFVKSRDLAFANVGDTITYSLTITNTGNVIANNVVITDAVPQGTSYVAGSLTGSVPVTGGMPTINVTNGVAAGQTITVSYKVKVDVIPTTNPIPNTATIAYSYTVDPANPDGATGGGPSNTVTTQVNNADLIGANGQNFVKSRDLAFANVGDTITYSLTITNTGNVIANNVVITDAVPQGTSYVAGSLTGSVPVTGGMPTINVTNGVAAGQTITVSYKVKVDVIPTINPIPNTATIAYSYTVDPANPNGATGGGPSNTVTTAINSADLLSPGNFVKSRDLAFANVGDTITYSLTITNTGNTIANNVVITDAVPQGTSYVAGSLTGSVPVTGGMPTINVTNGVAAGQTITVSYKVKVDVIPTTNPIPNTATIAYSYTIDPANPNGATATGPSNTVTTQVNNADLIGTNGQNFVKSRDLAFANVGDTITYSLTITNTGNTIANNVVITDAVPQGTSYVAGSLTGSVPVTGGMPTINVTNGVAAGQTITVSYKVKVDVIPTTNPIPNTATIAYNYTVDPANPNGATGGGPSNTVTTEVNNADLIGTNGQNFVKSRDLAFANVGDTITYSLTITNTGNVIANNVVITDAVPQGTSYVAGSLTGSVPVTGGMPTINVTNGVAAGQTITVSYKVKVDVIPTTNPIPNTATIAYNYTVDPANPNGATGGGPSNTVTTQVNNADLIGTNGQNFVKSRDLAFANVGDTITYSLTITNTGNTIANNVVITDAVPQGTSYVAGSLTGSVAVTGGMPTINVTNGVAAGQTIIVSYKVKVDVIPTTNPIPNTATIAYNYTVDPANPNGATGGGPSNTVTTEVNNADLIGTNGQNFVKSRDLAFANVGDTITYSLTITNTGNVIANNVVITDAVPQGTSYVAGSLTGSVPVTGGMPTINVTNGVAAGQTITVSYKVKVDVIPTTNPIPNTATIAYNYTVDPANPNGATGGGPSNTVTTAVNSANLLAPGNFVKSRDLAFVNVGDTITYSLTITNTGNTTANNVVITDAVPQGTSYVAGSLIGSVPVTGGMPIINVTNGVAAGQTITVSYKVKVNVIPTTNPIPNTATIAYSYTVDPANPNGVSATGPSNTVTTQVNNADLIGTNGQNFVKSRDLAFANVGDTITYSLTITNTGNVIANNVVITDAVPQGTSYVAGSLIGSVPVTGGMPTINVTNGVAAGQTITVSYKVKVDVIPTTNPIPNTATIAYNYTVDPANPNGATGGGPSNTVTTQVNNADLIGTNGQNFVKSRDLSFVNVGDTITYSLTITNTGNTIANNVVITDAVPQGTSYVAGSLTGSVPVTGGMPTINVTNGVAAGQTITVSYKVKVDVIPTTNPIPNTATIAYNYTVDPANPNGATGGGPSNTVTTQVNNADLIGTNGQNFVKSRDLAFANVGDTITYSLTITNTGNTIANNVVITDAVPQGTSYVAGSLTGSVAVTGGMPTINVTNGVAAGQTITVSYKVKVNVIPTTNPIPNTATIAYSYTVDPANPNGATGGGPSNTVTTQVNNADLIGINGQNFIKTVDKSFADIGDVITYTLAVTNTGNVIANNVVITDTVPQGTSYVVGSLIGSVPVTGVPGAIVITNGVAAGQTVTVSFKVKVDVVPTINPIPNKADINYSYTVDPARPNGATNSGASNTVKTTVNHGEILPGNAIKTADKAQTTPTDIITYTVTAKNTGNVPVINVVLKDLLPIGTTFVDGSVIVNGIAKPLENPIPGVNVGTILPNEIATVSFKVTVLETAVNPVINNATINYSYVVDPTKPAITASTNTNSTSTELLRAAMTLNKTADRVGAVVGDIIRYSIVAQNTGEVPLTNVIVTDNLNSSLQFAGNVTVNGVPVSESILTGVNIGALALGESKTVAFDAKVISIPADKNSKNVAAATYQYTVSGNKFTKAATSNEVVVKIYNPQLTVTKSSNLPSVAVGESFIYNIVVNNSGDIAIDNIIVTDTLPNQFTVTAIKVDGTTISGDIKTGINIGTINSGNNKLVELIVKVNGDLTDPYKNVVVAQGTATTDPNKTPTPVKGTGIDNAGIEVFNPEVTLTKSVDNPDAVVGDEVTYTITAKNTGDIIVGNVALDPVVVSDLLSPDLQFVEGSVTIAGVPVTTADILSGITIGTLAVGESKTISFKAKVVSAAATTVTNRASAIFGYKLPGREPNIGQSESNTAVLKVEVANLDVVKSADKDFAVIGDLINYTVTITNTGTLNALDVVFKDILDNNLELVEGSFTVNSVVINSVDLAIGVNIGNIAKNSSVVIKYTVKVTGTNCELKATNSAMATFNYILEATGTKVIGYSKVGTSQSKITSNSETVVNLGISNFKQISIEENLLIPIQKPDMEQINDLKGTIDITKSYVIKTPVLTSNEGQQLKGYKAIISGNLNLVLEYTALDLEQTVHSAEYTLPFTTFIILPAEYCLGKKLDLSAVVEHVYFNQLSARALFANTTALIKIIFCSCNKK